MIHEKDNTQRLMRLVLTAGVLLLSGLFIHTPAAVYSGNPDEFSNGLIRLIVPLSVMFLVGSVFLLLPLAVLRGIFLRVYAGVLSSLAIYVWVASQIVVLDHGVLNGQGLDLQGFGMSPFSEALLVISGIVLVALLAYLFPTPSITFLTVVNLGLLSVSIHAVVSDSGKHRAARPHADPSFIYRFSDSQNILIILMDSLQSDLFYDIITEDPSLKSHFAGFTFFKNTLGVARTTQLSMPSIISGSEYEHGQSIPDWYRRSSRGNFLTNLASNGVEVSYVNPALGICPQNIDLCVKERDVIDTPFGVLIKEAAFLLDLSLFRAAPPNLKGLVYNGEHWRVKNLFTPVGTENYVTAGNTFLNYLADRILVEGAKPTAKFYHLHNTHAPISLDANCLYVEEPLAWNRNNAKSQSRCAIVVFVELLGALRLAEAYENTLIVLLADHGAGFHSSFTDKSEGAEWSRLVGSANPVFLIKPYGAQGELRISEFPVHLVDLGATVCHLSGLCIQELGRSAFGANESEEPVRRYLDHPWRAEFVTLRTIPTTEYVVTGKLYDRSSWQRGFRGNEVRYSFLDFAGGDEPDAYGINWLPFERNDQGLTWRWAVGQRAEIYRSLSTKVDTHVTLRVSTHADNPNQRMRIFSDGTLVGEVDVPVGFIDYEFVIPKFSVVESVSIIRFEFDQWNLTSNGGTRHISVMFDRMDFSDGN